MLGEELFNAAVEIELVFNQHPGGFCSASLDADDALAAHSLAVRQALRLLRVCFSERK